MSETTDRIGNRILKIVAKHALKMVPVAQQFLKLRGQSLESVNAEKWNDTCSVAQHMLRLFAL
jgi:hypothetical protein